MFFISTAAPCQIPETIQCFSNRSLEEFQTYIGTGCGWLSPQDVPYPKPWPHMMVSRTEQPLSVFLGASLSHMVE